jgi:type I restriction enzyme R subunit
MLAKIQGSNAFNKAKNDLKATAAALEKVSSIPQVAAAMEMIKAVQKETFWEEPGLLKLEEARKTLRDLIKFLDHPGPRPVIITRLTDPVIAEREGEILGQAYDFESYRQKVNRYVLEHGDTLAIYKLTHNIRLAEGDYRELERVLTKELGSSEDYRKEYGDTPFGLMVRKIAKLDHEAAMQAFSKFINDQSLNQRQIAFLNKIILYIEQNGYMENIADLTKPPFDKPVNFTKMFSQKMKAEIVATINEIRDNAVITA